MALIRRDLHHTSCQCPKPLLHPKSQKPFAVRFHRQTCEAACSGWVAVWPNSRVRIGAVVGSACRRGRTARGGGVVCAQSGDSGGSTLYTMLGVSERCSAEDIKRAFRQRARRQHPDVNKAPDAQVAPLNLPTSLPARKLATHHRVWGARPSSSRSSRRTTCCRTTAGAPRTTSCCARRRREPSACVAPPTRERPIPFAPRPPSTLVRRVRLVARHTAAATRAAEPSLSCPDQRAHRLGVHGEAVTGTDGGLPRPSQMEQRFSTDPKSARRPFTGAAWSDDLDAAEEAKRCAALHRWLAPLRPRVMTQSVSQSVS
jgi:hypothetical protein